MKTPTYRASLAACADVLFAAFTPSAHADLLFRFYNQSPIAAKGIVQHTSVLWLRPDQNEVARATGDWSHSVPCPISGCPTLLKDRYEANFEHLSDASVKYCTWRVLHNIERQNVNLIGKRAGHQVGRVVITPKLTHELPGYTCTFGGQTSSEWTTDKQGQGAELYFFLKKNQ